MSRIERLVGGRTDLLPIEEILGKHDWLLQRGMQCVLSPDSDGLLCALFMSHFLDWEVVGFYDGKVAVIREGVSCYAPTTVFLDMEVYRRGVRSIGHHMVRYSNRHEPATWGNFQDCIQPNNLRNYDFRSNFRAKYPLATIHLLLALLGRELRVKLPISALPPLLFTDGTFNVLYSYPENVIDWLRYLRVGEDGDPLASIFLNDHLSVYSTMLAMHKFFRARDEMSIPGQRGDRLRISTSRGEPFNLVPSESGLFEVALDARARILDFAALLAEGTGWKLREAQWSFEGLRIYTFTKSSFSSERWRLNGDNYRAMIADTPLSWAITSGQELEFTLEGPAKLP